MNNILNQLLAARKHMIDTGVYSPKTTYIGEHDEVTDLGKRLDNAIMTQIGLLLDAVENQ